MLHRHEHFLQYIPIGMSPDYNFPCVPLDFIQSVARMSSVYRGTHWLQCPPHSPMCTNLRRHSPSPVSWTPQRWIDREEAWLKLETSRHTACAQKRLRQDVVKLNSWSAVDPSRPQTERTTCCRMRLSISSSSCVGGGDIVFERREEGKRWMSCDLHGNRWCLVAQHPLTCWTVASRGGRCRPRRITK
jgi:hypothetical protein